MNFSVHRIERSTGLQICVLHKRHRICWRDLAAANEAWPQLTRLGLSWRDLAAANETWPQLTRLGCSSRNLAADDEAWPQLTIRTIQSIYFFHHNDTLGQSVNCCLWSICWNMMVFPYIGCNQNGATVFSDISPALSAFDLALSPHWADMNFDFLHTERTWLLIACNLI